MMRNNQLFLAMLGFLLLLCPSVAAEESGPWLSNLQQALQEGEGRPVALLFVSESCPPCHRMLEESAESAAVTQALRDVVGVQIDSARNPVLAMRLGIRATPTLVLINRKMELVRVVPGYLKSADLATTLRVLALHGDEQGSDAVQLQSIDVATIAGGPDAISKLVALLGVGDPGQRQAVRAALARRTDAVDQLWELLAHAELGVRVDASAILAELVGEPTSYDPFAPAAERQAAAAQWRDQALPVLGGSDQVIP